MKTIGKIQLLLTVLFTLNSYGIEVRTIDELEGRGNLRGRRIIVAKDYYENKYSFDTTRPCAGRCFEPGTEVRCSSYKYVEVNARRKYAFCNISEITLPDGRRQGTTKKLSMMAGVVDYDANGRIVKIDTGAPVNTRFEANLQGQILPIPLRETPARSTAPRAAAPVRPAPSRPAVRQPSPPPAAPARTAPRETEAAVTATCENCEPEGPVARMVRTARPAVRAAERARPTSLNVTCNSQQTEENCHLCNCYHESRGESFLGKVAVIRSVLARINHPSYRGQNTSCKVIYAHRQFAWTQDRISNNISTRNGGNIEAYGECQEALVLAKERGPGTVHFYNPNTVSPSWARGMKICATIENHRFVVPSNQDCPSDLTTNPTSFLEKVLEYYSNKEKV